MLKTRPLLQPARSRGSCLSARARAPWWAAEGCKLHSVSGGSGEAGAGCQAATRQGVGAGEVPAAPREVRGRVVGGQVGPALGEGSPKFRPRLPCRRSGAEPSRARAVSPAAKQRRVQRLDHHVPRPAPCGSAVSVPEGRIVQRRARKGKQPQAPEEPGKCRRGPLPSVLPWCRRDRGMACVLSRLQPQRGGIYVSQAPGFCRQSAAGVLSPLLR